MATAATVFRDYETDGVPSSGAKKPKKSEIRQLLGGYESIISAFLSNGGLIFASKASLDASLNYAANTMAWVLGDATVANNGVYMKVGGSGSGSWTRVADLPFSFIIASDAGAGTANTIQATTSIPVSSSALVWMNVFEANTASPVTVSFNGGAALTIKTNTGNNVAAGGLVAGMIVMGIVSGSTFRLVSDQASAAIVAAAEAAQAAAEAAKVAAEAAAAGVNLPPVAANSMLVDNSAGTARESKTFPQVRALLRVPALASSLTAAQAIDPVSEQAIILIDGMRNGLFFWDGRDLSERVIHNSATTTSVNATTDECTLAAHGFMTGNPVRTTVSVDGLTANTTYYVIRSSSSVFKLASSIANAFAGTAVDLTGTTNITFRRLSDSLQTVFVIPTGKAIDGSQGAFVRDGQELTPQMFGAKADFDEGNTNDHDAIQLWFQTLLCLDDYGYHGKVSGRYYVSRNLSLFYTELSSEQRGNVIRGNSRNHDGFYFADTFGLELANPNGQAVFYIGFKGIRVVGNVTNGQLMTIGKGDFSDAFNSIDLDVVVNNAGTGTAKGLVLNYVLQSQLRWVVNGNASGRPISMGGSGPNSIYAVWMRQVQFCNISAACGNVGNALLMGDGFIYGNTFDGTLDIEEVDTGVEITGANVTDNRFLGGTVVATNSFECTNGFNNKAEAVTIGTGYTGWALFVAGAERIRVNSRSLPALSLTINPASTTTYRNTSGRKINVRIEGALTNLVVNKAGGNNYTLGGLGTGFPVHIELDAYDGFTPTYTGTPSFTYYPVD